MREDPRLTGVAFSRLLAWLDDGADSRGDRYLEIRRRLVSYFDRRNRLSADGLADETLRRIGGILKRDGAIATTQPARYCYAVAKLVLLEDMRREPLHVPVDENRGVLTARETECLARSCTRQEPPSLPGHTVRR